VGAGTRASAVSAGARAESLSALLERDRALREAGQADPDFARRLDALRAWQAARLQATYADLAREPRYVPAIDFFLEELYGSRDATPRDRDLARASGVLERTLPAGALAALEWAIELDVLAQRLDQAMTRVLPPDRAITGESYAAAYRQIGRRDERERQIAALVDLGAFLDRLVRKPGLPLLVRMARRPAHAAGFGALHDVVERGFDAFSRMGGAHEFLATIGMRERQLLERIYAGERVSGRIPPGR
jgi:hypothetical protein